MIRGLSFRQLFSLLFLLFIGLLAATALQAWTGPTGSAPSNNVSAPINVGSTDQVKNAGLSVNALTVFGSQYIQAALGIGRPSPVVALDVNGTLRIANGGEVCQSVTEGGVRYNSSSHALEYCNGTAWGPLATGATGATGPAGATGPQGPAGPGGMTACRVGIWDLNSDSRYWSGYSSGNSIQSLDSPYVNQGIDEGGGYYRLQIQCY